MSVSDLPFTYISYLDHVMQGYTQDETTTGVVEVENEARPPSPFIYWEFEVQTAKCTSQTSSDLEEGFEQEVHSLREELSMINRTISSLLTAVSESQELIQNLEGKLKWEKLAHKHTVEELNRKIDVLDDHVEGLTESLALGERENERLRLALKAKERSLATVGRRRAVSHSLTRRKGLCSYT